MHRTPRQHAANGVLDETVVGRMHGTLAVFPCMCFTALDCIVLRDWRAEGSRDDVVIAAARSRRVVCPAERLLGTAEKKDKREEKKP